MSKPKGACDNPFATQPAPSVSKSYTEMMEGVRLPGEDPAEVEKAAKKKDAARLTDMLRAQNGDKPAPATVVPPVAEKAVVESIKAGTTFTPELKKEMLSLAMDNDLQVDEVTDTKITITKAGKQFVIVPI